MNKLRIIPLGGLGEVGKNMMVMEYGRNIIIIDAGVMFPENDMLGIDLVIPDYGYLKDKKDLVRGIIVTHGHEDHVGALPYLLRDIQAPIYATRLTRGLIEVKLKNHRMLDQVVLNTIQSGDSITLGPFTIEFFAVNHSIPDGVGLAIRTPVGLVVHSGDFKIDYTPVDGKKMDLAYLAQLGGQGVLVLLSDSTNAEEPGFTPSEKVVEEAFDQVFREAPGRIIIGTFASLISRIQQVVRCAVRYERKVAITGRSMVDNVRMAQKLGYLNIPPGVLVGINEIKKLPPHQIVIMATGTQGEPSSALARMATRRHPQIQIAPEDTVILSAHPIPGNEEMVHRTINRLIQQGATVVYDKIAPVHVSGHGSQEDQKLMLNLIRPKYFVPIHGELRHLTSHARTAQEMGIPATNIFVVENGYILEFDGEKGRVGERVPGGYVFVDGAGVGDIGPAVMRDRETLARDGFVVVVLPVDTGARQILGEPRVVTRGFVYLEEAQDLIAATQEKAVNIVQKVNNWDNTQALQDKLAKRLGEFLYSQTRRRPMVLPVVIQV